MTVFLFIVYLFFYDTLKSFFVSIRIKSVVFHDRNKKNCLKIKNMMLIIKINYKKLIIENTY